MRDRVIGIDTYPLAWPLGWKRTPIAQRGISDYRVDFTKARDDLARELGLLCHRTIDVVISSNVPTRRDGLPYANQREPEDPGVAAYWVDRKGTQRVIACDAWRHVRENLRAVGLAVSAFRMIERTKASEILDRTFQGFAALPAAGRIRPWWEVLGLDPTMRQLHGPEGLQVIEAKYRRLALEQHPDRGGSNDAMAELNGAISEARKAASG